MGNWLTIFDLKSWPQPLRGGATKKRGKNGVCRTRTESVCLGEATATISSAATPEWDAEILLLFRCSAFVTRRPIFAPGGGDKFVVAQVAMSLPHQPKKFLPGEHRAPSNCLSLDATSTSTNAVPPDRAKAGHNNPPKTGRIDTHQSPSLCSFNIGPVRKHRPIPRSLKRPPLL